MVPVRTATDNQTEDEAEREALPFEPDGRRERRFVRRPQSERPPLERVHGRSGAQPRPPEPRLPRGTSRGAEAVILGQRMDPQEGWIPRALRSIPVATLMPFGEGREVASLDLGDAALLVELLMHRWPDRGRRPLRVLRLIWLLGNCEDVGWEAEIGGRLRQAEQAKEAAWRERWQEISREEAAT